MRKCRISNAETKDVLSLGELYVSDFTTQGTTDASQKGDLTLCFSEESKLLQLKESTPVDCLYGKYWYRSGINSSMRMALKDVVDSVLTRVNLNDNDLWLDIACNDGTLLSFVPKNITKVGIDPAESSYMKEAERYADEIIQDYFTSTAFLKSKFGSRKAKVVTVIAMFYDLDDPGAFLDDINDVMDDDGLLVLQMSYTPLMIKQLAFDNICHEHVCYYSLTSLNYLLTRRGFKIVDCELNEVNGGSFRIYIKKDVPRAKKFKSAPFRDVAEFRIQSLLQFEENNGNNTIECYKKFHQDIQELKERTVGFIQEQITSGKTVWAYGASTKGSTLLQWFGLDSTSIQGIAERSSYKYGLKTVGTNIPIYSEEEMRKAKPDYLLILPWHFVEEFKVRERDYLENGGAFIVPCPKFEIIR